MTSRRYRNSDAARGTTPTALQPALDGGAQVAGARHVHGLHADGARALDIGARVVEEEDASEGHAERPRHGLERFRIGLAHAHLAGDELPLDGLEGARIAALPVAVMRAGGVREDMKGNAR